MKRPAKKKPSEEPVPSGAPANWHRRLARVTGELSLAVVRKSTTKGQMQDWLKELDAVREEMNAFAFGPR
jgi:hypothetical protein